MQSLYPQAITTAFLDLSDKNLIEPNTHYILCLQDFVDLGKYGMTQHAVEMKYLTTQDFPML